MNIKAGKHGLLSVATDAIDFRRNKAPFTCDVERRLNRIESVSWCIEIRLPRSPDKSDLVHGISTRETTLASSFSNITELSENVANWTKVGQYRIVSLRVTPMTLERP